MDEVGIAREDRKPIYPLHVTHPAREILAHLWGRIDVRATQAVHRSDEIDVFEVYLHKADVGSDPEEENDGKQDQCEDLELVLESRGIRNKAKATADADRVVRKTETRLKVSFQARVRALRRAPVLG